MDNKEIIELLDKADALIRANVQKQASEMSSFAGKPGDVRRLQDARLKINSAISDLLEIG